VVSGYYTSPFENTILLTMDAAGDGYFSKIYKAEKGRIEVIASSPVSNIEVVDNGIVNQIPCSVGGIYTHFTKKLGFTPDADEGKVEALAAFGKHENACFDALDSIVKIDHKEKKMVVSADELKDFLVNKLDILISENKKEDIAAAIQKILEKKTEEYLILIKKEFGIESITMSGGVAANVINNLNIYEKICDKIHITPAMADDGSAQGAAIIQLLESGLKYEDLKWLKDRVMPYYSTSYEKKEITKELKAFSKEIDIKDIGVTWPEEAAKLLCQGKIGSIFHGKMEWGPRALGNRSLIADPCRKDFREKINKFIKKRPIFQPFCPSILLEEKDRLFEKAYNNKHMTCAFRMKKEFWEKLPSAIHVDGTARAQFVEEKDNPNYFKLLKKVKEISGFGVIINTSFNKHGRTIVENPIDAVRDFLDTDMDYLIIEGILITRKVNP
jgi:carbamoyltransferase